MLLQVKDDTAVVGGLKETSTFTIKASPKAFDILSSNLYQNKVLAVIREITCNAADAHKMNGRPFSDIRVTLPSYGEPVFRVRDFGPSMSHAQIMRLYTSYFDSTKDGNNDAIGGFGLGSKSPFSITDQFTVTAWQNGVRRDYAMYKVDGVPTVSLTSERPSNEPTGIEVAVAAGTEGITRWREEALRFFRWWPTLPAITGLSMQPTSIWAPPPAGQPAPAASTTIVDNLPSWSLRAPDPVPLVFMGLVPYSLNMTALGKVDPDAVDLFSALPVVLVFNVGDLEISPSRETLSYNKDTCTRILDRLKDVARHLLSAYKKQIDAAPSFYEARRLLYGPNNIFRGNSKVAQLVLKSKPTWQGKVVSNIADLDLKAAAGTDCKMHTYSRSYYGRNYNKRSDTDTTIRHRFDYHGNPSEMYVHTDIITSKTYSTIRHYVDTKYASNPREAPNAFYIVAGGTFADIQKAFVDQGFPAIEDLSTWPAPPKAAPGTSTRTVTRGYERNGLASGTSRGSWETTDKELDLKGGGYYVPFFDGSPTSNNYERVFNSIAQGLLTAPPRIIGLPKRILDTKKWSTTLATNGWRPINSPDLYANYDTVRMERYLYLRGMYERGSTIWQPLNFIGAALMAHKPCTPDTFKLPVLSVAAQNYAVFNSEQAVNIIRYGASLDDYPATIFPDVAAVADQYDAFAKSVAAIVQQDLAALNLYFATHPLLQVEDVWRRLALRQGTLAVADVLAYINR